MNNETVSLFLFFDLMCPINMSGNRFEKVSSDGDGAVFRIAQSAKAADYGSINMNTTTLQECSAHSGGCFHIVGLRHISFDCIAFVCCTADSVSGLGGSIYGRDLNHIFIKGTTFCMNKATIGGSLYLTNLNAKKPFVFDDILFDGNVASGDSKHPELKWSSDIYVGGTDPPPTDFTMFFHTDSTSNRPNFYFDSDKLDNKTVYSDLILSGTIAIVAKDGEPSEHINCGQTLEVPCLNLQGLIINMTEFIEARRQIHLYADPAHYDEATIVVQKINLIVAGQPHKNLCSPVVKGTGRQLFQVTQGRLRLVNIELRQTETCLLMIVGSSDTARGEVELADCVIGGSEMVDLMNRLDGCILVKDGSSLNMRSCVLNNVKFNGINGSMVWFWPSTTIDLYNCIFKDIQGPAEGCTLRGELNSAGSLIVNRCTWKHCVGEGRGTAVNVIISARDDVKMSWIGCEWHDPREDSLTSTDDVPNLFHITSPNLLFHITSDLFSKAHLPKESMMLTGTDTTTSISCSLLCFLLPLEDSCVVEGEAGKDVTWCGQWGLGCQTINFAIQLLIARLTQSTDSVLPSEPDNLDKEVVLIRNIELLTTLTVDVESVRLTIRGGQNWSSPPQTDTAPVQLVYTFDYVHLKSGSLTVSSLNFVGTSLAMSLFVIEESSSLHISECEFNMFSSKSSGSIALGRLSDGHSFSINNSNFSYCRSDLVGGVVNLTALPNSSIRIDNSTFTSCSSSQHGGIIFLNLADGSTQPQLYVNATFVSCFVPKDHYGDWILLKGSSLSSFVNRASFPCLPERYNKTHLSLFYGIDQTKKEGSKGREFSLVPYVSKKERVNPVVIVVPVVIGLVVVVVVGVIVVLFLFRSKKRDRGSSVKEYKYVSIQND
ncbi:hypothetical protein BLNAU_12852 [Blattamonas nauphoetae]|uniref:Right handed beta helix domain-containing protein n=1 Tax=Blattamonas nauphoetae TaxID=2049346 RepID=A0ABQ9XMY9_9EUKA|nr:hypothetical protein BLNAU_12852 [Blattamonas nauphoetae]